MELREQDGKHEDVRPTRGRWYGWADVIAEIHLRIAPCFARSEVRQRVRR